MDRPFEWAKDVKIFVSYVNTHKRVTSVQEDFNNQVILWPVLWMPVRHFPPGTLLISQWVHEQSCHGGRDGLSNMDFYSQKADLVIASAECPICQH